MDNHTKKDSNHKNLDSSDDIVFENSEEYGEKDCQEILEKLKKKLKETEELKQEYLLGWQKSKADFVNARRRDEEDQKRNIQYATEDLVEKLLPVLESFEMAKANKETWEKVDKNWRMGVEYIHTKFLSVLEENGLREIRPINQAFDPARDEAIAHEEVSDSSLDAKVVEVLQAGYELNGKLIRASKVKVGEYKKK